MDRIYNSYFYNKFYDEQGGGNYIKDAKFQKFFENVADHIVEKFAPKKVLDVGCAAGYLVGALRKRGVDAYGIDISSYAIAQVQTEIKKYCAVHDVVEPLPAEFPTKYDLVICIEVLEHLYEEQGKKAIANLCHYSDRVLFTSTPDDIDDQTHVNVQRLEYWGRIFAENSFYRNLFQPMDWVCPWAVLFEKREKVPDIINEYEIKMRLNDTCSERNTQKLQKEIDDLKSEIIEKTNLLNGLNSNSDQIKRELKQSREKNEQLEDSCRETNYVVKSQEQTIEFLKDLIRRYEDMKDEDIDKIAALTIEVERKSQEYANLANAYQHEQYQTQYFKILFEGISDATAWKMTKPLRILTDKVKKIVGKPEKESDNNTQHGPTNPPVAAINEEDKQEVCFDDLFTGHKINPIKTIIVNEHVKRLNLVTDTIEASSLLGGVATALIVATKFALKYDYELRIITRTATINPLNYKKIIEMNGIEQPRKVTYYSDFQNKDFKLELSPDDVFFATSWWSAEAIIKTSLKNRFFYIIQEVETFFYPHGVEHYLCSRVMKNNNIDFIINSHYLYDYFKNYEPNIVRNGVYFEPAFSKTMYYPGIFEPKTKYKLFFYARPNNPRNMYSYGIYLLDLAFKRGIINPEEWEVYFAGQKTNNITLASNVKVHCLGQLSWKEYTEFLRSVDLTLSLMYTPHPSYPPYDAACSGGVVVTNKCFNKVSMPECKNIIVADLCEEDFLRGIAEGEKLAKNMEQRKANYEATRIKRDWDEALPNVLTFMGERMNHV